MNQSPLSNTRAFTLIELLIVVAIISILASIAVPNFLEAQTRAKTARVKADMRTLTTAIVTYQVDHNTYPFRRNTEATDKVNPAIPEIKICMRLGQMQAITTPIAYLTTLPVDIFEQNIDPPNNVIDYYDPTQVAWLINDRKFVGQSRFYTPEEVSWMLISVGPDGYLGSLSDKYNIVSTPFDLKGTIYVEYDPTNGTVSVGNLFCSGDGGMDQAGARLMQRVFNK